MSRASRAQLALLCLVGCPRREAPEQPTPTPAAADVATSPPVVPAIDVPHATVGTGASGPWHDARLVGAAASQGVWSEGRVMSVVGVPAADGAVARLSWVRWSSSGAEIVAQRDSPAMEPGASIALSASPQGWAAVWRCPGGDGGGRWCAQAIGAQGFVGDPRDATEGEREGALWSGDLLASRRPERADLLAREVRAGEATASLRSLGRDAALTVDGVEVLRGADLRSYAPALALAVRGGERWVALSRGRCGDARVELWSVRDRRAEARASFPVRAEVGFRWMRVEAAEGRVALSWYQELIPIRLPCVRLDGGARVADHGVRVAQVVL